MSEFYFLGSWCFKHLQLETDGHFGASLISHVWSWTALETRTKYRFARFVWSNPFDIESTPYAMNLPNQDFSTCHRLVPSRRFESFLQQKAFFFSVPWAEPCKPPEPLAIFGGFSKWGVPAIPQKWLVLNGTTWLKWMMTGGNPCFLGKKPPFSDLNQWSKLGRGHPSSLQSAKS